MEDEDEAQSYSPEQSSLPAAAAALIKAAALSGVGGANGGGREDCWSEGATATLIEAWGERFMELSRGNLRQHHWQEVADIVSARDDYTKPPKSDVQCKNRVDTLKKKYKLEKTKSLASSKWVFFRRLDQLLGSPPSSSKPENPVRVAPYAIPTAIPVGPRSFHHFQRKTAKEDQPSVLLPGKRRGEGGMRELTRAIMKFGEVYERVERSKLKQLVDMERQRMGFAKEMELQRMHFFMKTQLELTQLKPDGCAPVVEAAANSNTDHSD